VPDLWRQHSGVIIAIVIIIDVVTVNFLVSFVMENAAEGTIVKWL
jgi:hypothetical protein